MSSPILDTEEQKQLEHDVTNYDYVRFSWADFNGILRGKTVPSRHAVGIVQNGFGNFPGTISAGPATELPNIKALEDINYGNIDFVAASPLFPLPWAGDEKHRVAQVFCEAFWADGSPFSPAPRTVARRQLQRLDDLGMKLFSAFETEFFVVDATTKKPVFDGLDFCVDQTFAEHTAWLFDLEERLVEIGVDINGMHLEYSPGQFEFCFAPAFGIKTADNTLLFKQACKEVLPKYNRQPTFMTRPFAHAGGSSGFHFNHSLWTKDGKSLFYDVSKPDKMSDVMQYWVGGLMKHISAVLAFCSPTPNCYRRLHRPWAPGKEAWGIDARQTALRVKTTDEKSCLVENRLPSTASNAYLVMAATIAAGLDGIENRIEPPAKGTDESNATLPRTLEDSIKALEESDVMRQSLGEEFLHWYITSKRQNEISKFSHLTLSGEIPEDEIRKEREEYFKLI